MKTKTILILLVAAQSIFSCKPKDNEQTETFHQNLIGYWESDELEKEGDSYSYRQLELSEESWQLEVMVYQDKDGHKPLFELEFEGTYEITEPSPVKEGSFNGTYNVDSKHLTLLTQDEGVISSLGFDTCGLEYGKRIDVAQGCSFIESIAQCPTDYDLITLKNGMLYRGKRLENMCEPEGRPTELGSPLKRVDNKIESSISKSIANYKVEQLASDMAFLEGPIWDSINDRLIFSEVNKNRLLQWSEENGISTFLEPSNYAGGNVFDNSGNIISCQGGGRQIARIGNDGKTEVIVNTYNGKQFNSPNDAVVKSDGTIWFTDPDYGLLAVYGEKASEFRELESNHIFMYDPVKKEVKSVYSGLSKPNGLVFSKDEKVLYVGNSEEGDRKIVSFEVTGNNGLRNIKLITLIDSRTWGVDGLKIDGDNNLYAACGDGVNIFSEEGILIQKIETDFEVTNLCFGENSELFLTGHEGLYKVNLN